MKPGYVMIAKFYNEEDVPKVQGPLEELGIECLVTNQLVNQLHPRFTMAFGGISLYVPVRKHDQAVEVLLELNLDQYLFAGLPSKTEEKIGKFWYRYVVANKLFSTRRHLFALIFILFLIYVCFIA